MSAKSAYIHIPFCAYKCDFCDFAAFAGVDHLAEEYLDIVCKEIALRLQSLGERPQLESVFFGGGTPGLVPAEHIARILSQLSEFVDIASDAEITLETTPHSITLDKCKAWLSMGVNRLSVGVQSLLDSELKAMGRDHRSQDAFRGIETGLQSGFENLSCDLMYGLPEQTIDSWQSTLSTAISFNLPHMSAYGLTIAGNSPLLSRYPKDSPSYPPEDDFALMYKMLVATCEENGLAQYEISNFARPGYESTHNLAYWQNQEYLAFGVSAHRYVQGRRTSNLRSLMRYMKDCLSCEVDEVIDEKTRLTEALMLGLRMRKGINLNEFESQFGTNLLVRSATRLKVMQDESLLEIVCGNLRLTQKGILVSNLVISELI